MKFCKEAWTTIWAVEVEDARLISDTSMIYLVGTTKKLNEALVVMGRHSKELSDCRVSGLFNWL